MCITLFLSHPRTRNVVPLNAKDLEQSIATAHLEQGCGTTNVTVKTPKRCVALNPDQMQGNMTNATIIGPFGENYGLFRQAKYIFHDG
jgi:hypothetical protein